MDQYDHVGIRHAEQVTLPLKRGEKIIMAPSGRLVTSVEPLHVGQFMLSRCPTDHCITGYGEAGVVECPTPVKP